ncbi:3-hydroxyacyl-CoA dehydrogenase/enoyl-CoA hydratase/3-hydroxybutyryl-CoA epimerase/enoyl-CoA isomerase [Povalibacter uvarum]|uniref:enoyl-CoA hydratase n=1 Tax=Povalibacter uvarum TaxID=732238 RepID=A0A841HTS2_9GAMM|nr:fatty acid oxidation complex subunit alpha FadB [Povalibacter uvarum]MBB6095398.1 3-hydroxyacyl-CoA dehydrogenase/enoyl-CoA hydratase/3-hydroxybutyryl-CoA epimerase/enoyl-CoA isomerase [Povalibacter uvarum]
MNAVSQAAAGAGVFDGQSIQVRELGDGLVELCFDARDGAINKFDKRTVDELKQAVAAIAGHAGVRGVLMSSGKDGFIVGADITEFGALFSLPPSELAAANMESNKAFIALEALPVPVVVAINGFALGGGLEAALAADFRVMSTAAQAGLPEVKLGLFPGFGGTVRLPRIAGMKVAIEWITSGKPSKAEAAKEVGVADAIAEPAKLREQAIDLLKAAAAGTGWRTRREARLQPVAEAGLAELFATSKTAITGRSPRHQPAALAAVELLEQAAPYGRDAALQLEADAFARIAKTQAASSLVQIFLNDQFVKKASKTNARGARPIRNATVLGAGIMGGGIAYTSASRGIPVRMKDIRQEQLDLGSSEAGKLVGKQVSIGRLRQEQADAVLKAIGAQLDYAGVDTTDVVVEAVVENLKIKHAVLSEVEALVRPDAVIASNTSSLRIDDLAVPLARPENFVGMHFFNPVPVMPLVEVIRGARTSDAAVATIVSYALALGKTPIVVKDGPGFLVNRILTPYMQGFGQLIAHGADFEKVDEALESFGWPMGPAYLNDVVGMDTGVHVAQIICAGFPDRLRRTWKDPLGVMVENRRFGQKNGVGFYRYETDPKGKPRKLASPESYELLRSIQEGGPKAFSPQEMIERMMLPMIIESARCLEEGVVASAPELDMAMLLGVGFPQYLGGPLKYADWLGLKHVVALSERYGSLGPQYLVTPRMREMASASDTYY